jgi:hypothetical protein
MNVTGVTCDRSFRERKNNEKIFHFKNTDVKSSGHTVTVVTPIVTEDPSLDAKNKSYAEQVLFSSYYRDDHYRKLKGLHSLKCMFCECYSPIKFDMELHLYENHRKNLLTDLPINRKVGFGMDNRIVYAIDLMESEGHRSKRYFS